MQRFGSGPVLDLMNVEDSASQFNLILINAVVLATNFEMHLFNE
jgi:hypothetical protein